jgi:hypothetical protein
VGGKYDLSVEQLANSDCTLLSIIFSSVACCRDKY